MLQSNPTLATLRQSYTLGSLSLSAYQCPASTFQKGWSKSIAFSMAGTSQVAWAISITGVPKVLPRALARPLASVLVVVHIVSQSLQSRVFGSPPIQPLYLLL